MLCETKGGGMTRFVVFCAFLVGCTASTGPNPDPVDSSAFVDLLDAETPAERAATLDDLLRDPPGRVSCTELDLVATAMATYGELNARRGVRLLRVYRDDCDGVREALFECGHGQWRATTGVTRALCVRTAAPTEEDQARLTALSEDHNDLVRLATLQAAAQLDRQRQSWALQRASVDESPLVRRGLGVGASRQADTEDEESRP